MKRSAPHLAYGVLQIAVTLVAGAVCFRFIGRAWPALAVMAAWLPILHATGLAGGFWLAWRLDPSPARRRGGLTRQLATYLYECCASVCLLDLCQPWRSAFREWPPTGMPRPFAVLCLHGYGCNRAYWLPVQRRLAQAGYHCRAINLTPLLSDIDDYADGIAQQVDRLHTATGLPVVLLCHSMGGVAARAFLRRYPGTSVMHTVTLGSPHHGTRHAGLGLGKNAHQMQCGSPWLAALAKHETAKTRQRFTSIYTWHDNVVYPARSSRLEGACNIPLDHIGHVALGCHPRAIAAIMQSLNTLG